MAAFTKWPSTQVTLIEQLKLKNDGPQWAEFVAVYGPLIYRFCRRRGAQDSDAQDVTQNVFLSIRRGIDRFIYDPGRGKFRGWLGTIVTRELGRDKRRSTRAGLPCPYATAGIALEGDVESAWTSEYNRHICTTALERIRPDFEELTWSAFDLLWNLDTKPADVAATFSKPVEWVYQVKYRVLRRLETEVLFLTTDIPSFSK